ncbi:MAG TPA: methyltransferase domain-containing protein [Thermoplasmata archaeon]|nr:methyltransferase domain-containing protein [Thermoplasmata archaeon]
MRPERRPPAERVRERLRAVAGDAVARAMPSGYQRLGRVLVLRLPASLRPYHAILGAAWREALGVATVLVRTGPIDGELRTPRTEAIAGSETETEVIEHGIRWRFDAAQVMFAAGNRTERRRAGRIVADGDAVIDLFAGIGYFAIPIARSGRASRVLAVEKNPVAVRYLRENVQRNGVAERVQILAGDNRTVALPARSADRVFLGYLPSAIPWIGRAVGLLRADGGWLHVHTVADAREAEASAAQAVGEAVAGVGARTDGAPVARAVKPYGPGRTHVVVDVRVVPGRGAEGFPTS